MLRLAEAKRVGSKAGDRVRFVRGDAAAPPLRAEEVASLVVGTGREAIVRHLPEAVHGGRETGDERYVVVSAG